MDISIINYEQQFAPDFKRLNMEWLDKYGLTEQADVAMLDAPEAQILATGGSIFLGKCGDEIVASGALIQVAPGEYELAKMAVAPAFQGMGISKQILEKCLADAAKKGAVRIFLLSNSQLKAALALYQKYGFSHVPVVNSHYHTADVMMEKIL